MTSARRLFVPFLLMLAATACTPIAESSGRAADATKQVIYDSKRKWSDLFTYNPPPRTPQLPQTRYCYKTQADIVCYDSPQQNLTSKLVGYQDGMNISGYQPGGGALGVSGAEPVASYNVPVIHGSPVNAVALEAVDVDTSPAMANACAAGGADAPFYCNESPYVAGAVTEKEIAPPSAR